MHPSKMSPIYPLQKATQVSFILAGPGDVICAREEVLNCMTASKPRYDNMCQISLGESLATGNTFQGSEAAPWNCFLGIYPFTRMTVVGECGREPNKILGGSIDMVCHVTSRVYMSIFNIPFLPCLYPRFLFLCEAFSKPRKISKSKKSLPDYPRNSAFTQGRLRACTSRCGFCVLLHSPLFLSKAFQVFQECDPAYLSRPMLCLSFLLLTPFQLRWLLLITSKTKPKSGAIREDSPPPAETRGEVIVWVPGQGTCSRPSVVGMQNATNQ